MQKMLTFMTTMNETAVFADRLAPLISLVATSVIALFGLPLNIFLLVVFIKSAALHTLENSFVVNLITADILLGIRGLVTTIFRYLSFKDKSYKRQLCLGMHSVNMFISSAQLCAYAC